MFFFVDNWLIGYKFGASHLVAYRYILIHKIIDELYDMTPIPTGAKVECPLFKGD